MKSASSLIPVFATVLLHAALVALTITGLNSAQKKGVPPKPVPMQLLQEKAIPPAPTPVSPAAPVVVPTPPQRPPQKKPEARPHVTPKAAAPKSEMQAHAPAAPQTNAPVLPLTPTPAVPGAAAAPIAPATPAPAPSTPAKIGVSISAHYAATNRKPPYPRLSRQNEEQGVVELRVFVKPDGTAGKVEIASSSGYPLLDESARNTVQSWRFTPATVDGKPVGEWYRVPVPFTLHD